MSMIPVHIFAVIAAIFWFNGFMTLTVKHKKNKKESHNVTLISTNDMINVFVIDNSLIIVPLMSTESIITSHLTLSCCIINIQNVSRNSRMFSLFSHGHEKEKWTWMKCSLIPLCFLKDQIPLIFRMVGQCWIFQPMAASLIRSISKLFAHVAVLMLHGITFQNALHLTTKSGISA